MSRHNCPNSCHGTLAFSYLQLLILQWYILLFRRTSDGDRSAGDSGSRVGSGTSACQTAAAETAAVAFADSAGHRVVDARSHLFSADSFECSADVLEVRVREAVADGSRIDAEAVSGDVAAAVARRESSDDSFERFVSLASAPSARSSSRSRSSIQFLRSFRYDLRREK